MEMEKKYFSLSPVDNGKIVKIIQAVFGIICIGLAVFWIFFNLKALKDDRSSWVTILFLIGFGLYMIWAGLGKAMRFVEIDVDKIRMKKTILFSTIEITPRELKKIEVFPFKIVFILKTDKKTQLTLSSANYETNENIKDAVVIFAEENSIAFEEIEEKI
jgi:hypothetical protein